MTVTYWLHSWRSSEAAVEDRGAVGECSGREAQRRYQLRGRTRTVRCPRFALHYRRRILIDYNSVSVHATYQLYSVSLKRKP